MNYIIFRGNAKAEDDKAAKDGVVILGGSIMKKHSFIKSLILVCLILSFSIISTYAEEPSSWAKESVEVLKAQNVLQNEFYKNYTQNITRKDFAYLSVRLYETLTEEMLPEGDNPFTDTSDSYVIKGYHAGILSGYGGGLYGPDDLITREQLAILLMKTLKAAGIEYDTDTNGSYFADDSSISDWAKSYVYLANCNGLLNGVGCNMVAPKANATREQSMIMADRILEKYCCDVIGGDLLEVHFIDVGQGDASLIKYKDFAILIDGGDNAYGPVVVDYLNGQDIDDIDIMVATHVHADHIGGLDNVLCAYDVHTIIDSGEVADTRTYQDYMSAVNSEIDEIGCVFIEDKDMVFEIDDNISFRIIEMGDDYSNSNDNSVVSVLSYNDVDFLFTGDLEEDVERAQVGNLPENVEVYQVGHHGSNTSSSLEMLNKTTPEIAIISAGIDNKYGHPHEETLVKFKSLDIETYCISLCGSIEVITDGLNVTVGKGSVALDPDDIPDVSLPEIVQNPVVTIEPTVDNVDVSITSVDKVAEIVKIRNDSATSLNMSNWTLVSVAGNQTYSFPNGFNLGAGCEVQVTSGRKAVDDGINSLLWCKSYIWNNDDPDPAELYDSEGNLLCKR
jgi:beta-lactamase superfamily II metal-dependent hydrolase